MGIFAIVVFILSSASVNAAELVPITSGALYFSPYNTDSDGKGSLLSNDVRIDSSYAQWVYPGSYLKTSFTGSNATLSFDIGSIKNGTRPKLRWSVDNRPFQVEILKPDDTRLVLAKELPAGKHSLILYLASSDANYDRWKGPEQAIRIKGLFLDDGAKVESPQLSPKRVVFFGDSITESAWVLGNSNRIIAGKYVDWVAHSDATQAWPRILAAALDAEYGACGSGGMSWLRSSHSGIPPLPESWSFHDANHSRLTNGRLNPAPDAVIVNMGTNDGEKDTSATVEKWLKSIRNAIPRETPIFVIVPFGQMNRTHLNRAVNEAGDPHVHLIDLGVRWAEGLKHYGTGTTVSFDGLHPNTEASGLYAALLASAIRRIGFK